MKMKVLKDYKQLEGKTISFSHMAQFAEQITLVTTDDEVLMATFEGMSEDDLEIRVFGLHNVISVIQRDKYIREELSKLGVFDLEEWKQAQAEKQRQEEENRKKAQEERDKKEYERLKAKFEGQ
jgi:hypothetical protein